MKFLEILEACCIDYRRSLNDSWVISNAQEIVEKGDSNGRTPTEMFKDASNGLALQVEVLKLLKMCSVDAEMEVDSKAWDLNVFENNNVYHVDVKGIFKEGAKNWTQTFWEAEKVPRLSHEVFYLCFNCTPQVQGINYYVGWCTGRDFAPSTYGTGPYISAKRLRFGSGCYN